MNNELAMRVYDLLEDRTLEANLETIGNVLVRVGMDYMDLSAYPTNREITTSQLVEFVILDRKEKGETIANATVLSGLNLLTWIGASGGIKSYERNE